MVKVLRFKYFIISFLFFLFSVGIQAQTIIRESLFTDDYTINPSDGGQLKLSIDNLSFFRNNEFDGDLVKGYTAPGFRLSPHLTYHFSPIIKLEAGVNLLRFWGANKYPNYAYQGISEWKPDDYQVEFHITPFFRAQIQPIPQINVVLGNIYGGANHGLIEPLYNSELNYLADMETGAQFLYDSKIAHLDTWINWETFTFKKENYNEAFTVGGSAVFHITNPQSALYVGIPAQIVIIHRGGEINGLRGKKKTMGNGAAGLRVGLNLNHPILRKVTADAMIVGYDAQYSGGALNLPSYSGGGFYSGINLQIWNARLKMAYWHSNHFINMLGPAIFGNVSMVHEDWGFIHTSFFNPGLHYEQEFGTGFYLGADIECFYNPKLKYYAENNTHLVKSKSSMNISMGVYLRINPSIILRKF